MSKTKKEQFVEALEHGITHKAMYLLQFMKNKINELYDYRSPLFWASRYGNEKVAQALREMGAVEKVDKEGMGEELLKILGVQSADEIDEKRAIELIKDGANIEKKDTFGQTALIWASRYRRVEVVKTLLSRGAKVDEKDNDGDTALLDASKNGYVKIVKTLIEKGAEVDEKDNRGVTALIKASSYDNVKVVKTLIENGAMVDEKDNRGYTALILASQYGYIEVVEALIENGAKVDEKNNDGKTALIMASRHERVAVVEALLDAGADVTITDNKGYTAIDNTSDDEIKKMLKEALRKQKEKQNEQIVINKRSDFFGK